MKKSIIKYSFAVIIALFTSSCSEDNTSMDTTKPEINLLSPQNEEEFHLGDELNIEAILKDNEGLGTVKIDIHSAGDGHHHKSATSNWEYSYEEIIPAGKKEHAFSHKILIPKEGITEGGYHLGIFVIDQAGNQNQAFVEIDIMDEHHEH